MITQMESRVMGNYHARFGGEHTESFGIAKENSVLTLPPTGP